MQNLFRAQAIAAWASISIRKSGLPSPATRSTLMIGGAPRFAPKAI
ncbi:hypothetical protein NKG95_19135 [Mesorhizobium sp. M1423]